jgi:ubiquinone/menaquinone biosynthesis C-methylase UbiE
MKVAAVPEGLIERIVNASGRIPTPLMETANSMWLAQIIASATKVGVFESLAKESLSADEIASRCGINPFATGKLLNALAASGYLRAEGARYGLTRVARDWLLKDSPLSVRDFMPFQLSEWRRIGRFETFLRDGKPLKVHQEMSGEEWQEYQRAMRAVANLSAAEVARRTPAPRRARSLLDIGGSHGYYSVALCRRHAELRATILDLPEAIEHAAPILAREGMGDRVVHRAGNALTDELGSEEYDLVFLSHFVHLFDAETNLALAKRVARATRPGGYVVIQEIVQPESVGEGGQSAAFFDLNFALGHGGSAWTFGDMAAWLSAAGLRPSKPLRLRAGPSGLQAARKPS